MLMVHDALLACLKYSDNQFNRDILPLVAVLF